MSSSDPIVSALSVGKKYRLGQRRAPSTLRESLTSPAGFWRRRPKAHDELWALHDVSFDVAPSEIVGVIGRNGAGKSTLLKILSQITSPTVGEVHLRGRVASLLEVGVGFHPELTGRENIYLNGAILGMTRAEIRAKYNDIVAFSELEQFLETPVKRYSSGMYVRLAFAVAAHLDSDILLVDEVLAVGDAAFQKKCLGRIDGISRSGRTVLLVSHNLGVIGDLCTRTIWLDRGKVAASGPTRDIVQQYLAAGIENDLTWTPEKPASSVFEYHAVSVVRGDTHEAVDALPGDAPIEIVFDFTVKGLIPPGRLLIKLSNDQGQTLFMSTSGDAGTSLFHAWVTGRQRYRCTIPPSLLAPGRYFLSISEPTANVAIIHEHALNFTVSEQNTLVARDRRPGIIAPRLPWIHEVLS